MKTWIRSAGFRAGLALVAVYLIGGFFSGGGAFLEWGTQRDLLRQIAVPGILACGMTLVILTGGIDLSVGSVLGLASVVFSTLMLHHQFPPSLAIPLTLAVGLGLGLLSGFLIAFLRLQPFVATLALMVFARGAAKFASGGEKISRQIQDTATGEFRSIDLPRFYELLEARIWGGNLTVVTVVFLFAALLCYLLVRRHRYGRYLLAVGGNEEASRLSGVPVQGIKLLAYGLSGLLAGIAGILQAVQEQQGDPEAGVSYELTAIAMSVIGGTSLAGGRGGIGLTVIGVLTIGALEKILSVNAVAESHRLMLTGAIIVGAVLFQRRKS